MKEFYYGVFNCTHNYSSIAGKNFFKKGLKENTYSAMIRCFSTNKLDWETPSNEQLNVSLFCP